MSINFSPNVRIFSCLQGSIDVQSLMSCVRIVTVATLCRTVTLAPIAPIILIFK